MSALLLSWEDEDPQLPVSLEIQELKDVLSNLYGFEVNEWHIPSENSHVELNMKILTFLKDSSSTHLKIVYYAGHGRLSNHGQAVWARSELLSGYRSWYLFVSSHRNSLGSARCPTVKWSGIQNALEESVSDVLVLLDCCASGMSNTDEGRFMSRPIIIEVTNFRQGNGVTELIAACAFNNTANGVGPFSFTHALISQLRKLVQMPSFTVGYLYNLLFADIQTLRVDGEHRKKVPIHLVLTQDHRLPRSITLSAKRRIFSNPFQPSISSDQNHGSATAQEPQADSSGHSVASVNSSLSGDASVPSSTTSISQLPEYPRLLFSIHISEDIKPKNLSTQLFADWLTALPIETKSVRIEAGFASDSTLLLVSMPVAMLGYLSINPAITILGTARSGNLVSSATQNSIDRAQQAMLGDKYFDKPKNPDSARRDQLDQLIDRIMAGSMNARDESKVLFKNLNLIQQRRELAGFESKWQQISRKQINDPKSRSYLDESKINSEDDYIKNCSDTSPTRESRTRSASLTACKECQIADVRISKLPD